jgi:hypothetical protein
VVGTEAQRVVVSGSRAGGLQKNCVCVSFLQLRIRERESGPVVRGRVTKKTSIFIMREPKNHYIPVRSRFRATYRLFAKLHSHLLQ